ncbi:MAG TPA: RNA 2',3'-cyclic phosphodiesterase [Isosphaeraceae bacterium]|jgi:2'-5' RNA ligase
MPRTTRTFIALPVPGAVRTKLEALQKTLAPGVEGARWVGPDAFHLTLAFLGDVADPDLNAVCLAVAESVRRQPRFSLEVRGLGAFPDAQRPRILWAGIEGDLDALAAVQRAAFEASTAAGYRPADERFHPHVTLARLKPGRGPAADLAPVLARYRAWKAGPFPIDTVTTYASTTSPDGPAYAPLGRAALAAKSHA